VTGDLWWPASHGRGLSFPPPWLRAELEDGRDRSLAWRWRGYELGMESTELIYWDSSGTSIPCGCVLPRCKELLVRCIGDELLTMWVDAILGRIRCMTLGKTCPSYVVNFFWIWLCGLKTKFIWYIYKDAFSILPKVITPIFNKHITYVFILVYRFEYVHILILRYSRSYHTKNFQRKSYFFNILLKCHYCSIYNKYNHILYVCMHT
jgi:hypothetical protein